MRKQPRILTGVLIGMSAACGLGAAGMQARPQEDGFRLLSRAVVGSKTAYIPLNTEWVCASSGGEVSVSPDATDALLFYTPLPPVRAVDELLNRQLEMMRRLEQSVPQETNLLLWSFDSRRAATVWRGGGSFATGFSVPIEIAWLPGTRIALVKVMVTPPTTPEQIKAAESDTDILKQSLTFVRINAATGKTQTLLTGVSRNAELIPSNTDSVVALITNENSTVQTIQRIDASGVSGTSFTIAKPAGSKHFPVWLKWLPDGRTLRGITSEPTGEGKPYKRTFYRFDALTGAMTVEETPPAKTGTPPPTADALPFVVQQRRDALTQGGVKTEVYPLWLEGRDKDLVGRTLIAADSDPDFKPILLTGAILYRYAGSLYAVPLLKASAANFLAQRRDAQKQETIQRAKSLGIAFMMYGQDYDENLPPVGSDLTENVNPYLRNPTTFQSPVTGQFGFTPLYKSPAFASFTNPSTTPLGYLSGPGGVAIVYLDGHVQWEDRPGNGKP